MINYNIPSHKIVCQDIRESKKLLLPAKISEKLDFRTIESNQCCEIAIFKFANSPPLSLQYFNCYPFQSFVIENAS